MHLICKKDHVVLKKGGVPFGVQTLKNYKIPKGMSVNDIFALIKTTSVTSYKDQKTGFLYIETLGKSK